MSNHLYNGHVLRCERDPDSDGFYKLEHICVCPDGREIVMDVSPYHRITRDEFETYVDLGYPTRRFFQSVGPITADDLRGVAAVAERLNVPRNEPDHLRIAYVLAS